MDTVDVTAAEAKAQASVANARITAHEDECARRYGEVSSALTRLDNRLDHLQNKMMTATITAALTLVGLLGQVVMTLLKGHS